MRVTYESDLDRSINRVSVLYTDDSCKQLWPVGSLGFDQDGNQGLSVARFESGPLEGCEIHYRREWSVGYIIEQLWMFLGALDDVVGMRREIEWYEREAGVLETPNREAKVNLRLCHGVNLYRRLFVGRWLHLLDDFIISYGWLKYRKVMVERCGQLAFTC